MIDIYLLESLVAFRNTGSLSAASRELMISQPALSREMKKLEELLEVSLFERTANSIRLNQTGILAADMAERILKSEEEFVQIIRNYDRGLHTLSVGYIAPGPMMDIPAIISQLYPEMTVSSAMHEETDLVKGLFSKQFNMIFLTHPLQDEKTDSAYCTAESLYISAVPAHPLAIYQDTGISFGDINGETFVMAAEVGIWDQVVRQMMPDSKFVLQESLDSLMEVINASSLPGFATDLTLRLFGTGGTSRVFVPIKDSEAKMSFYCIWLKENSSQLSRLITALKNR